MNEGVVVIGPVVDLDFSAGAPPAIFNAVTIPLPAAGNEGNEYYL